MFHDEVCALKRYRADDFQFDSLFHDVFERNKAGSMYINFDNFDRTVPIQYEEGEGEVEGDEGDGGAGAGRGTMSFGALEEADADADGRGVSAGPHPELDATFRRVEEDNVRLRAELADALERMCALEKQLETAAKDAAPAPAPAPAPEPAPAPAPAPAPVIGLSPALQAQLLLSCAVGQPPALHPGAQCPGRPGFLPPEGGADVCTHLQTSAPGPGPGARATQDPSHTREG